MEELRSQVSSLPETTLDRETTAPSSDVYVEPAPNPPLGPSPVSVPRWADSSMPFFVIVRDSSSYSFDSSDLTSPGSPRPENIASSPTAPVSPAPSNSRSHVSFNRKYCYPEIRYVFSDDDFSPIVDVLDNNSNGDKSVVIDFDSKGEQVVSARSLASDWQISDVSMAESAAPSWTQQSQQDDQPSSSVLLFVDGTSSAISQQSAPKEAGSKAIAVTPPEIDNNRLIQLFQQRNNQLRHILHNYLVDEDLTKAD